MITEWLLMALIIVNRLYMIYNLYFQFRLTDGKRTFSFLNNVLCSTQLRRSPFRNLVTQNENLNDLKVTIVLEALPYNQDFINLSLNFGNTKIQKENTSKKNFLFGNIDI